MHRVSIPREVDEEVPCRGGPDRSGKYEQPATAKAIRMTLARTLARDHQLVQVERQAARGLRRPVGGRRDLFDEIHLPAFFQDLLARERAQARGALKALVLARELVVVDRRGASGGSWPGGGHRCGRLRLLRGFGVVADFFPLLPAVALAVDIDRIADPEDERRPRGLRRKEKTD